MRHKFITKCVRFFITKCDSLIINFDSTLNKINFFRKISLIVQVLTAGIKISFQIYTVSGWYAYINLKRKISHIGSFIFRLNAPKGLANLCSFDKIAQRRGVLSKLEAFYQKTSKFPIMGGV